MFGKEMLSCYIERTKEYQDLPDADSNSLKVLQREMKEYTLDKFFGLMFLKQSDQSQYRHLLQ